MYIEGQNINDVLPEMLNALSNGSRVPSRNGDTAELTFVHVTLQHPQEREILLPTRKHNLAAQIAETMWVLAGRNDVEFLSYYLPRAAQFSDDGVTWRAAYGRRLRAFANHTQEPGIDQFRQVYDILTEDINSRRAVMSIWDPTIDLEPGKDIPCNDWLSFLHRDGALNLQVGVRSNDAIWGWSGINAFEWSTLLEVMAGLLGVRVGQLHFSITSLHVYEQHWERARKIVSDAPTGTSIERRIGFDTSAVPGSYCSPVDLLDTLIEDWFAVEQMIRTGERDLIESAINNYPEPMFRSWLQIIAWWWTGDAGYLDDLGSFSRLAASARVAVQPKPDRTPAFIEYVDKLHQEKHAAYGDSWKRRGEFVAIQANIARKVDRLATGITTADETQTDTAIDLLVYLCKYRWWLYDQNRTPVPCQYGGPGLFESTSDHTEPVLALLRALPAKIKGNRTEEIGGNDELTEFIQGEFERLTVDHEQTYAHVDYLLRAAFVLAYRRWSA